MLRSPVVQDGAFEPVSPPRPHDRAVRLPPPPGAARGGVAYSWQVDGPAQLLASDSGTLELPRPLRTLVSRDQRTFVQYGGVHDDGRTRIPTSLYWSRGGGAPGAPVTEFKRVTRRWDELPWVRMSDDGWVAVGGRLVGGGDRVVEVYSPAPAPDGLAVPVRAFAVAGDRKITGLLVSSGGRDVVASTVDAADPLSANRLVVWTASGARREIAHPGVVQRMVLVGEDGQAGAPLVFVQGRDTVALVDVASASMRWLVQRRLRMVSPHAAALTPDRTVLLVVHADLSQGGRGDFDWLLSFVDVTSGRTFAGTVLTERAPASRDHVLADVEDGRARVLVGELEGWFQWTR